ncbi:MAG: Dyp-type peroxidase [Pyrinomonadaceae bacterium]|nr:Dyp-type peroxidase [Pyrinomonadaceae bacterium]
MPSRRKDGKDLKQKVAKALENLWKAEGDVARQERFSATGANFGPQFAAKGVAPKDMAVRAEEGEVAADGEPVFEEAVRKDVQGNIIPGFNKDYQHFLFYRIGTVKFTKKWLQWIAPLISSMDEVLAFNRMYRSLRFRLGSKDVPIKATWVNIAFSCEAIAALTSKKDCLAFGDESFRQGLAARSEYLGDPTDRRAAGNKRNWVIGGPKNEADILVIVASDDAKLLRDALNVIKEKAEEHRLRLLFEQAGETLPAPLRGHEHFGFKDGISQPGVRGRVSAIADDYITPRYIQPTDPRSRLFAKPGQLLVWPGQFLLGMQRQNPENLFTPAAAASNFPKWAASGSFLVCRRLQQDVKAFWEFVVATATSLGVPAQKFASMLVGRWPSGAPVARTPNADVPALGADDLASNHFLFDDDTRPSNLIPISGYPGDTYSQARADMLGLVCPHFAHVRKVNPRDSTTDLGKVADSLIRMILRRGIPFGPAVAGVKDPSASLWKKERGLMFVSYQSSIEDQFEFITRRWSNSVAQPNVGGHDPIIGQEGSQGSRERFIDFPAGGKSVRVTIKTEWVIPTGGGYFFSPPIGAIAGVLGS